MPNDQQISVIPDLAGVVADPGKVSLVSPEAVPAMLGDLERVKAALWARLVTQDGNRNGETGGDQLLDATEAAAKIKVSKDWIYHHHADLPFTVRIGSKLLFSAVGIDRWIKVRSGR